MQKDLFYCAIDVSKDRLDIDGAALALPVTSSTSALNRILVRPNSTGKAAGISRLRQAAAIDAKGCTRATRRDNRAPMAIPKDTLAEIT